MGPMIAVLALEALAFQQLGKGSQALASLEQALALAEPEGYVRTFVNEGKPMARLLYRALEESIHPEYASRLLAAFGDEETHRAHDKAMRAAGLIEPLTPRETEVLQLIADGLTNQEIGRRLSISLGTVKRHTANINGKLAVRSRTQAAAKARALGILPG